MDNTGYFATNQTRDQCICAIALILAFYILYCYYMQQHKEGLDNRPIWALGSQRDDLGSTNSKGLFGMGFSVDQSKRGVPTNTEGVDFKFGQSFINAGGFQQSEYGQALGAKEGLDQKKEKLEQKTTEDALQQKLFSH